VGSVFAEDVGQVNFILEDVFMPTVSIDNLSIVSISRGSVRGAFDMSNLDIDSGNLVGLGYQISLRKISDVGLIDVYNEPTRSILRQGKIKNIDFVYKYLINISSEEYKIIVLATWPSGGYTFATSLEKSVNLEGNGIFFRHFV